MSKDIAKLEMSGSEMATNNTISALEKIPFVEFTTGLVENVLKSVIESQMTQMEAYADLVSSVAGTLADYEQRVLGSGADYDAKIAFFIDDVLGLTSPGPHTPLDDAKGLFEGLSIGIPLGADSATDSTYEEVLGDDNKIAQDELEAFVGLYLKAEAKSSYDKIVALVKMGVTRIVIKRGSISTKLTLQATGSDYTEASSVDSDEHIRSKSKGWGLKGGFGGSGSRTGATKNKGGKLLKKLAGGIINRSFGGHISGGAHNQKSSTNISVSVVNEKTTAATNMSADIIGAVHLEFESDYFPQLDPTQIN